MKYVSKEALLGYQISLTSSTKWQVIEGTWKCLITIILWECPLLKIRLHSQYHITWHSADMPDDVYIIIMIQDHIIHDMSYSQYHITWQSPDKHVRWYIYIIIMIQDHMTCHTVNTYHMTVSWQHARWCIYNHNDRRSHYSWHVI